MISRRKSCGRAMIDRTFWLKPRRCSWRRTAPAVLLVLLGLALACAGSTSPPAAAPPGGSGAAAPTSGAAAGAGAAPTSPPRKLTVAYATEASLTAPLWVTKDQGLFDKYGLDV